MEEKLDKLNIMEVCGTHTMAIAKNGLKDLLPSNINLISGPGCPVCVTSNEDIDKMIALADMENTIIATFGDMVRVPGSTKSLQDKSNVEIVYSSLDALNLAKENPDKQIIFLGIGFETTAPTTALAIQKAFNDHVNNFSVFSVHKTMPQVLRLIAKDNRVDAFLLPGHVSTIIGVEPYEFLYTEFGISGVISGFEPEDILQSINMLTQKQGIQVQYTRGVNYEGNKTAVDIMNSVFNSCDSNWRGLGEIKNSGLCINETYSKFDASKKFDIKPGTTIEHPSCKCGDILRGILAPNQCPLFQKKCTPEHPVGPCMVSSEGTCAAFLHNI